MAVSSAHLRAELDDWIDQSWDPALTVREWWERLGTSGWAAPHWPVAAFGRGLSSAEAATVRQVLRERGVLGPPAGLGLLLAGPTIYTHGTAEQVERFLPDILCGRTAWCQLFSEPAAGSDLAGLQTRAVRDGDEWRVTGQKVWTSSGHIADWGMLIARTDPDAPKRRGITYFLVDMHQPGVEIRPLREMTGRSLFNEVFLDDVVVRDVDVVGGEGNGWAVTTTTLAFERAGLGAGSSGGAEGSAFPGSVVGHLDRLAGELAAPPSERRAPSLSVDPMALVELAHLEGAAGDPLLRQRLAQLHIEHQIGRYMALRGRDLAAAGDELPGLANMAKLRMSAMFRQAREIGLGLLGERGMLHDYEDPTPVDERDAAEVRMTSLALWSLAPSIYGGTDQIQRNILAERVLGLPRDGVDDSAVPFKDLPRNA
jgi:alkylation response protein AidB-like acyl-CoA dehydrogenase